MSPTTDTIQQAAIDLAASDWFARRRLTQGQGAKPQIIDPKETEAFEAWLNADPRHRDTYQLMVRTFDDIIWSIPSSGIAPSPVKSRPNKAIYGYALAACVSALAVIIGLNSYVLPPLYTKRTGIGETKVVRLDDGSQVTLSARSAIEIRSNHRERHIILKYGEAYFDVVHDTQRPFHVTARDMDVRDVGTRFDINLRRDSTTINVAEGAVAVKSALSPPQSRSTLLVGGQGLRAVNGRLPTEIDRAHENTSLQTEEAWLEGRLTYDNAPLSDIIDDVNRYYAPGVKLMDARLGQKRLTTTFRVKDIDTFLSTLPMATDVTLQHQPDKSVIILQRNKTTVNKS